MVRTLRRDASAISNLTAFILAVIIAVAIIAVYFVYLATPAPSAPLTALPGDQIQLDYIGTFPNSGAVFDTSNSTVGHNNASYPKAFSFAWRTTWTDLSFTIGDGSIIPGVDNGVRGLQIGESATIVVPASQGYGALNLAAVFTYPLVQPVPVKTTWNESAFTAYFKTSPASGATVVDPVFGWVDSVSVSNGYATVTADPVPGQAVRPYNAWNAVVQSIDDTANNGTGVITVANQLAPSMVDFVGGTGANGTKFYLSAVDLGAGTFTLNYNRQVVGRTLMFQVTVITISRIT